MFRALVQICLINLAVLTSIARGQAGAPIPATWPPTISPPAATPPKTAPVDANAAQVPSQSTQQAGVATADYHYAEPVQAAPLRSNAMLAPDPAPPRWGNYAQPAEVPLALPPVDYALIGPPRGWVQPNVPNEYRAVVNDPRSVPENDIPLTQPIDLNRADGMAPSGVLGAVTMPAGRVLMSYGYLQNSFDHNFVGTHQVSNASVRAAYPFAPTQGISDAQLATLAWGVSDDLTVTASLPYEHNQIDYETSAGSLRTAFSNPGDIRLSALYVIHRADRQQVHLNLGISAPVGLLETLPQIHSPFPVLPTYALRTSSGTYDLLPGYTYRGQTDNWSWGVQMTGVVRLGFNTLGYKQGDQLDATGWVSRLWTDYLSTSARLDSSIWGNIGGQDNRLDPAQAPTNSTLLQGGRRINLLFGMNYYLPADRIAGQYLTVEAGLPIYQSLDGPQLGLNWILNASWTMVW